MLHSSRRSPGVAKDNAPVVDDVGPVVSRHDEDVFGYAIQFLHFRPEMDGAPLLKGLPEDRCPCPHWGYVLRGAITFTFPVQHTETYRSGDAFYVPPGHTPANTEDTEYLQFSPTAEHRLVTETIKRNAAAMALIDG